MVPPFVKPSLASSLVVALFISSVFSFCSARTLNVVDICSKHIHPSNCNQLLYKIPAISAGISLEDILAPLTLSLSSVNAYEGLNLAGYLFDKATQDDDPQWKKIYGRCLGDYLKAVVSIENAEYSLILADYGGVKSKMGDMVASVRDCSESAAGDPSILPTLNSLSEDMGIISQIVADFLAGKYN